MENELNRRKFLRALLAAPVVAVAAKAAVDAKYVPEIKEAALEELKELEAHSEETMQLQEAMKQGFKAKERIFVPNAKEVFHPDKRIWRSVANEAEGWAAAIRLRHPDLDKESVDRATRTMARVIDRDLREAEVDLNTQIIVETPHVTRTWLDPQGRRQVEIAMGVEKRDDILGGEGFRVGFLNSERQIKTDNPAREDYVANRTPVLEQMRAPAIEIGEGIPYSEERAAQARRAKAAYIENRRARKERKAEQMVADGTPEIQEYNPKTRGLWDYTKELFLG